MGETRNAGNADHITVAGSRGGKTAKVAETIKQYIGGFSKREKQLITEALEQDTDDEEEPPSEQVDTVVTNWFDFPDLPQVEWKGNAQAFNIPLQLNTPTITTSVTASVTAAGTSPYVTYQMFDNKGLGWLVSPQKKEIEEDVQDVDFTE